MKYPITQIVAERRILWRLLDGTQATIVARFGLPSERNTDGYCPYEIARFPGDATGASLDDSAREVLVQHAAFGADSVQALYLALVAVGAELGTLDGAPESAADAESNYGFPTLGVTSATDV